MVVKLKDVAKAIDPEWEPPPALPKTITIRGKEVAVNWEYLDDVILEDGSAVDLYLPIVDWSLLSERTAFELYSNIWSIDTETGFVRGVVSPESLKKAIYYDDSGKEYVGIDHKRLLPLLSYFTMKYEMAKTGLDLETQEALTQLDNFLWEEAEGAALGNQDFLGRLQQLSGEILLNPDDYSGALARLFPTKAEAKATKRIKEAEAEEAARVARFEVTLSPANDAYLAALRELVSQQVNLEQITPELGNTVLDREWEAISQGTPLEDLPNYQGVQTSRARPQLIAGALEKAAQANLPRRQAEAKRLEEKKGLDTTRYPFSDPVVVAQEKEAARNREKQQAEEADWQRLLAQSRRPQRIAKI